MPDPEVDWLDRLWRLASARRTRAVSAWVVCLATVAVQGTLGWRMFDNKPDPSKPADTLRTDGNRGHTYIDFGGQWVFGRMAATGHAHELYDRNVQWKIVRDGYRREAESPAQRQSFPFADRPRVYTTMEESEHDAEGLMGQLVDADPDRAARAKAWEAAAVAVAVGLAPSATPIGSAVHVRTAGQAIKPDDAAVVSKPALGGPLYPPVHAFFYAPLGAIPNPQLAYRLFQVVAMVMLFPCGWAIRVITDGRVWVSVSVTLLLLFPGPRSGIDLGQNATITLTLVLCGWAAVRGRTALGGAVWGLLAFKPVWAAAFLLVPLLMRRWKFAACMVGVGGLLVLGTLPFVGVQGWKDWFTVGKEAAGMYNVNLSWVNLSRDVSGIPRRMMLDFDKPDSQRNIWQADLASNLALGAVVVGTATVYLLRGDRTKTTGLSCGFLLLGAFLSCYRFMYYDVVLCVPGVVALLAHRPWLFAHPRIVGTGAGARSRRLVGFFNSVPLTLLALLFVQNALLGAKLGGTVAVSGWPRTVTDARGETSTAPRKLTGATDFNHPTDTLLVIGLWAWSGWQLLRRGRAGDDESVQDAWPSSASSAAPMSGERISDSPTSTA